MIYYAWLFVWNKARFLNASNMLIPHVKSMSKMCHMHRMLKRYGLRSKNKATCFFPVFWCYIWFSYKLFACLANGRCLSVLFFEGNLWTHALVLRKIESKHSSQRVCTFNCVGRPMHLIREARYWRHALALIIYEYLRALNNLIFETNKLHFVCLKSTNSYSSTQLTNQNCAKDNTFICSEGNTY